MYRACTGSIGRSLTACAHRGLPAGSRLLHRGAPGQTQRFGCLLHAFLGGFNEFPALKDICDMPVGPRAPPVGRRHRGDLSIVPESPSPVSPRRKSHPNPKSPSCRSRQKHSRSVTLEFIGEGELRIRRRPVRLSGEIAGARDTDLRVVRKHRRFLLFEEGPVFFCQGDRLRHWHLHVAHRSIRPIASSGGRSPRRGSKSSPKVLASCS